MTMNDNKDIVRAVGFVAVYGAYLEDRIAELVDMSKKVIKFKKNIDLFPASEQAKHLLKSVQVNAISVNDYPGKNDDVEKIIEILNTVESYLKKRHLIIHSTLKHKSGREEIIIRNRRNNIEEQIESKEVMDLANGLFDFQSEIDGLKFPMQRLINALTK